MKYIELALAKVPKILNEKLYLVCDLNQNVRPAWPHRGWKRFRAVPAPCHFDGYHTPNCRDKRRNKPVEKTQNRGAADITLPRTCSGSGGGFNVDVRSNTPIIDRKSTYP